MGLLILLAQFLVEHHRLHHGTGCADWPGQVSDDRNPIRLFPQYPNCVQNHLGPSSAYIYGWKFRIVLHRFYGIGAHMRLIDPGSHLHLGSHLFCFNGHEERNAIILKTAIVIYGFGQSCHHPGICMGLWHIDVHRIHQIRGNHIHHSAGTDAGRPVYCISFHYIVQSFLWSQHFSSPFSMQY